MARILLIDDDPLSLKATSKLLTRAGHEVRAVSSGAEGLAALDDPELDLVVTDLVMPEIGGAQVLAEAQKRAAAIPVLVVTAHGTVESAVDLMRAGACDYLLKPVGEAELGARVERALRVRELEGEVTALRARVATVRGLDHIVGDSRPMIQLLSRLPKFAESDAPILVEGESGTGKEVIARAVHGLSRRADGPFVPVHCGAIPETLFESELFGHVRGAFTDAKTDRIGLATEAHGGTLFFDELAELPMAAQVKLLRFLQTGEVRPVGSDRTRTVEARVVAATNRDVQAEVSAGRFREDLFYRIAVLQLRIPPLRERKEDIPLFAKRSLDQMCRESGEDPPELSSGAVARLLAHDWPGNVRELENVLRRALVLASGPVIDEQAIVFGRGSAAEPPAAATPETLRQAKERAIRAVEREFVIRCLAESKGNVSAAARACGKDRKSFWELMQKYGIESGAYREERE